MTQANKEMLHYLAELSRIAVEDDEVDPLVNDLSKILHHVDKLNEVDTENVKPCTYVTASVSQTPLRDDSVENTLDREFFLENSPQHIGGHLRVPPVLREE